MPGLWLVLLLAAPSTGLAPLPACTRRAMLSWSAAFGVPTSVVHAACLEWDTDRECVGVYKERTPISADAAASAGIRWAVPDPAPRDADAALAALDAVGARLAALPRNTTANARGFSEVGVELLASRPRVGAAGKVVYRRLASATPSPAQPGRGGTTAGRDEPKDVGRLRRASSAYRRELRATLVAIDAADVALGFAIRDPDVGNSIAALEALQEADAVCAKMLAAVPRPLPRAIRKLPAEFDDLIEQPL